MLSTYRQGIEKFATCDAYGRRDDVASRTLLYYSATTSTPDIQHRRCAPRPLLPLPPSTLYEMRSSRMHRILVVGVADSVVGHTMGSPDTGIGWIVHWWHVPA